MRERARDLLPQVLLTLQSLIQAIALEGLWSRAAEAPHLYAGGPAAWVGWLQVGAVVLGILVVWLMYTSLAIRYLWTPTTRDSLFPFGIGLLEFAAIELLGPDHAAAWLASMGAIYVLATWSSFDMVERANREAGRAPARFMDRPGNRPALAAIFVHFALAVVVAVVGGYGIVVGVAFAIIALLLLLQILTVRRFTKEMMRSSETE